MSSIIDFLKIIYLATIKIFVIPSMIVFLLIIYDLSSIGTSTLKNVEVMGLYMKEGRKYGVEYFLKLKSDKNMSFDKRVSHDIYSIIYKGDFLEIKQTFFFKDISSVKLLNNKFFFEEKSLFSYAKLFLSFLFLYTLLSFKPENRYVSKEFLYISIPIVEFLGILLLLGFFEII